MLSLVSSCYIIFKGPKSTKYCANIFRFQWYTCLREVVDWIFFLLVSTMVLICLLHLFQYLKKINHLRMKIVYFLNYSNKLKCIKNFLFAYYHKLLVIILVISLHNIILSILICVDIWQSRKTIALFKANTLHCIVSYGIV